MNVICPVCNDSKNLCWDSDEAFDDIGRTDEGVAYFYHCEKCRTSIEIYVPETVYPEEE